MADLISLKDRVATSWAKFYPSQEDADVKLKVGETLFSAHRLVLKVRNGWMKTHLQSCPLGNGLEIRDTTPVAFERVLQYIYTGEMSLKDLGSKEKAFSEALSILKLVQTLSINELKDPVCQYLKAQLTVGNASQALELSLAGKFVDLEESCRLFYNHKGKKMTEHASFKSLSPTALSIVIKALDGALPEIEKFNAIREWSEGKPALDSGVVVSLINFSKLTPADLNVVRSSGLLNAEDLLTAIMGAQSLGAAADESSDESDEEDDEGWDTASCISGVSEDIQTPGVLYFVDGNAEPVKLRGAAITKSLTVKLASVQELNTLKVGLVSQEPMSYIVELSTDDINWIKVIDYSKYKCCAIQGLFFEKRQVRSFRFTRCGKSKSPYSISFLKWMLTPNPPKTTCGVIMTGKNAAVARFGARVIDNPTASNAETTILLGKTWDEKLASKDFSHVLRPINKPITVQFPQPYAVKSASFVLSKHAQGAYRYFAEVSADGKSWTAVVDKRNEDCDGPQRMNFEEKIVNFLRIVGTQGPQNLFSVVHVQCPFSFGSTGPKKAGNRPAGPRDPNKPKKPRKPKGPRNNQSMNNQVLIVVNK